MKRKQQFWNVQEEEEDTNATMVFLSLLSEWCQQVLSQIANGNPFQQVGLCCSFYISFFHQWFLSKATVFKVINYVTWFFTLKTVALDKNRYVSNTSNENMHFQFRWTSFSNLKIKQIFSQVSTKKNLAVRIVYVR